MSLDQFRRLATLGNRALPKLSLNAWVTVAVPMALCLSQIVAVGPTLQETIVGLLNGDAPSIYGTAYKDSLVAFPTLGKWLLLGFHWLYVLMAALPIIYGLHATRFSELIVRVSVGTFLVLCATDVLFGLIDNTLTFSSLFVNLGANFVGSILIGGLLGAIFWVYERLRHAVAPKFADVTGMATLILLGTMVSALCYFVLAYFYKPLSASFEVIAKAPTQGGYLGKLDNKEGASRDERTVRFSALPDGAKGGRGEAMIPSGMTAIDWQSNEPSRSFDLAVDFYSDCAQPNDIRSLPGNLTSIRRQNVKSFKMGADKGVNQLIIAEDPENQFSYSTNTPNFFWLKSAEGKQAKTTISFFGGEDATLTNRGSDSQLFYLNVTLLSHGKENAGGRVSPRTIKFLIDGKEMALTFQRPRALDPNGQLQCKTFKVDVPTDAQDESNRTLGVPKGTIIVGARIGIKPRPTKSVDEFREAANTLRVRKASGWSEVADINSSALQGQYLGEAELLFIENGLAELKIDGSTVSTRPTDQFVAIGEIEGRYQQDLSLHIRGEAKAMWLDSKRRNPTRWERLPVEVQIFAMTAAIAVLGGLARSMRPIVKRFSDPAQLEGL